MKIFTYLAKYLLALQVILLSLLVFPAELQKEHKALDVAAIKCLADNAWHEARSEGTTGMQAVIEVTLNRTRNPKYPKDTCEVVWQSKQFSWTNTRPKKGIRTIPMAKFDAEYTKALTLAKNALEGRIKPLLSSEVLWYHTHQVKPVWRTSLKRYADIGNHRFYER